MSKISDKPRRSKILPIVGTIALFACRAPDAWAASPASAEQPTLRVTVDWTKVVATSNLSPSVYVVTNPMMRPGSPIHGPVNQALKALNADYLRYMAYSLHPRLSVAALYPPKDGKTSWDFSTMDPLILDFFKATEGRPAILELSTFPAWFFKTGRDFSYADDPDRMIDPITTFHKEEDLADPSGKQLADYYARVASWYTKGGFTDELGKFHKSGHRFEISHWEVLNEPDAEFRMTPETYTRIYDEVVSAVRKITPNTKFVGLSMAESKPEALEYFLDAKNHRPGIPIDMISYHFYQVPAPTEGPEQWQYTFFSQTDSFVNTIKYLDSIRKRLSPSTQVAINETATLLPTDLQAVLDEVERRRTMPSSKATQAELPAQYWNLSGAAFAYSFMRFSALGIHTLNMSHGVGYPGFYPSLAMFNWNTGKPNARYWTLELLIDNFGPGDDIVKTELDNISAKFDVTFMISPSVVAKAYKKGTSRKLLLINRRDKAVSVALPDEAAGKTVSTVDRNTGEEPYRTSTLRRAAIEMAPFAVSVVTLAN